MIKRIIENTIQKRLNDNKAIIILGARQVGKTTLIKNLFNNENTLWLNGDESDTRAMLENVTSTQLKAIIGKNKTLVIDEAQRIKNIGLCIKLITDNITDVKVIATGSSAFELSNKINEPLTGRKWEFNLFPLSFAEMVNHTSLIEERRLLEHRLIYGYYPDVVNNAGDEQNILKQLTDSYLYKDLFVWENIHKPDRMEKLVQALAFQIGSEVSFNELGKLTGLDNETVEKYISLLEKAYIIFRLGSFSRNLRSELKKSRKIYFYDNGIRNAIIKQFNPAGLRQDIGALWENFLISERIKYLMYNQIYTNQYFWRTTSQQEIDYIEERNGTLYAFEFKWNENKTARFPKTFTETYKNSETECITKQNFEKFLGM